MTERHAPAGHREASRVLALLFAANLLNFYDRAMPAVVIEEIRADFGLDDTAIGLIASALTLVYALAGLPLGRLADRRPRKDVIAAGLAAWSVLTAATGAATGFVSLLLIRLGVGIGEASYAPAATSMVADLYPPQERSRAMGRIMLGLPVGLVLAYFTVGALAEALGSWRAPFLLAGVPGLILAVLVVRLREPARGAADGLTGAGQDEPGAVRRVAAIPTVRWLVLAFLGFNIAAYTVNTFTVPLLQRSFGLGLTGASITTGLVLGVTGLVGLTAGGRLADRASRRSVARRLWLGAGCLAGAAPLTLVALALDGSAAPFAAVFAAGWLLAYVFYPCCYAAIGDVVEPARRGTAVALLLALGYLLGGAAGPLVVGALSDAFAAQALADAGGGRLTDALRGEGLRSAMRLVVPSSLALGAVAMALAARTITRDRDRMLRRCVATMASNDYRMA
jgi:predicted MFS family arabinose efflux permease